MSTDLYNVLSWLLFRLLCIHVFAGFIRDIRNNYYVTDVLLKSYLLFPGNVYKYL